MIKIPVENIGKGSEYPYTKIHNDGKVIEEERVIYLRNESASAIIIKDITEVRVGKQTIRFATKDGRYVCVQKYEIIWMDIRLAEDGLQL